MFQKLIDRKLYIETYLTNKPITKKTFPKLNELTYNIWQYFTMVVK